MSGLNKRILVVDDDSSLREICQRHLEKNGYVVRTADCVAAGIEAYKSEKPDLMLLDLKMPDGSGQDVLAEITTLGNPPPVIVVTAFNDARMAVTSHCQDGTPAYQPRCRLPFQPDIRLNIQRPRLRGRRLRLQRTWAR